ncbi:hypothetical protein [Mycobacterium sp.]|uniref:hypothetical protein n=1 Tax=Mycobacterium sp. TaxID=1785 RepID=UPI0025F6C535|nr:hypothetical protein [Mycobacterium sp.]MBW0012747.1 hypothetical protein [Mycobacterium sp.]
MRSRRWARIRRIRAWLALCAAIALIPWTIFLALSLPESYTAQHWQATWVGFDVLLLVFMTATAVLGFTQHHLLTLFAFTTGILLVCDAWFDVLTAKRGDFVVAVLTAVLGELPLAAALIVGTLRIVRLQGRSVRRPVRRLPWPAKVRVKRSITRKEAEAAATSPK